MNGKSVSIPFGMIFRSYHCAHCGARLKKEKTHRVVTKDDRDYRQYHGRGSFPQRAYDVYNHRFMCPSCGARVSYDEQRILERIQKKQDSFVLSPDQIKADYEFFRKAQKSRDFKRQLFVSFGIILCLLLFIFFYGEGRETPELFIFLAFLVLFAVIEVLRIVRRYKTTERTSDEATENPNPKEPKKRRFYSYDEEQQMEKLHAYSSHNKDLVAVSQTCYCFYCLQSSDARNVTTYTDDGQTAVCPHCHAEALLPDSIDDPITPQILSVMHEYWF